MSRPTTLQSVQHLGVLTGRSLTVALREPWSVIPNVAISVFFLLVYSAGLSGIDGLRAFGGTSYLAFILPVALVSGSVGGAGAAGQALIRDVESGFLTKLRLTPVPRAALVLAPVLAGIAQLLVQAVLIVALAAWMGLRLPNGLWSAAGVVLLTAGWGLGFAGYAVAVALRSRSGGTAQAATFVFFPLLFLSDTFVPLSLIHARWLRVATHLNPTTYVFGAMRTVLGERTSGDPVAQGVIAIAALAIATIGWAVYETRRSLRNP